MYKRWTIFSDSKVINLPDPSEAPIGAATVGPDSICDRARIVTFLYRAFAA